MRVRVVYVCMCALACSPIHALVPRSAGTMCFGLNVWVGWLVGAVTIANGLFNAFVLKTHPAFKSGELSASANPYENYSSAENQAAAYIKANPELARKAGSGLMTVAAQNPGLMARGI